MSSKPSLLLSYAFLKPDYLPLPIGDCSDWVLDSGAYTAHNSGKTIHNADFVKFALEAKRRDPNLKEVFALDVIGDHVATLKNALEAQSAGLDVIPAWHVGEPIEHAKELAARFPKIALGGMVARLRNNRSQALSNVDKHRVANAFFAAVWPKWIHGFGCTGDALMNAFPFASVDSTTWKLRPQMYGSWKAFGRLPVKMNKRLEHCLKAEIDYFLKRQKVLNFRWSKELKIIQCAEFKIRFACTKADLLFFRSL